ncbi:MAG: response regulator [Nitrospirae bacterium]|nr:response regulator [Nitrospirota bacterium]
MYSSFTVILSIIAYMLSLFLIALIVERKASEGKNLVNHPVIYSLSLAIYCTAWTFYGSVGLAAGNGLLFTTVYIGPTVSIILYWLLLRKLVIIKNKHRITSIADFLSTRYGKSQAIAALVSLFLLIGIAPYIALQLKAIFSTIDIVTHASPVTVATSGNAKHNETIPGAAGSLKSYDTNKDRNGANNALVASKRLKHGSKTINNNYLLIVPVKNNSSSGNIKIRDVGKVPTERNENGNKDNTELLVEPHHWIHWVLVTLLIMFTILFGVRRLDPTERHQGIVMVVAIESIVKIIAFVSVGVFVTFFVYSGFNDIFVKFHELSLTDATQVLQLHRSSYSTWLTYFLLSMSAILFLPRQFHVSVIENFKTKHILTAMWLFPLYMLLINIFVYPIALGGLIQGIPIKLADSFVLLFPKLKDIPWLTMFVFIGGFSASTSMVIVCSMTLSTMVTNHIILPFIVRTERLKAFTRHLLYFRWLVVAVCISMGSYLSFILTKESLVPMGMISFAAVFQLVPSIIGGLFWSRGNKMGAMLGLCSGYSLWFYTLFMPALMKPGFIPREILDNGLFGLAFLKPEQLFGLTGVDSLTNGVFWSIFFNSLLYIGGSIYFKQTEEEKNIAENFVDVLESHASSFMSLKRDYTIELSTKLNIIKTILSDYFGKQKVNEIIKDCIKELKLENKTYISLVDLIEFSNMIEKILSGSTGASSASFIIKHSNIFTDDEKKQFSNIYSNIIAELNLSPSELRKKIDYHKEKEAIQAKHTEELENKVNDRTAALLNANEELINAKNEEERINLKLNAAYEKLKDLDKVKTDFLSNVSHELRTPLTSVVGFAKMTKKRLDEVIYPMIDFTKNKKGHKAIDQVNSNLDIIFSEGMRLTSLINDVLDIAKMEAGKVDWKKVSVSIDEIIEHAIASTSSLFEKKNIQLVKDVDDALPVIMGDRDRIIQVVINLISNAVKFTEEGFVSCRAIRGDGEVIISISDTGIGISSENHQGIFEKFKQVGDTLTNKIKGTGLGLSICKEIIEYHGGKIWVESNPGHGSVFSFTLPFNTSSNERMKIINTDIDSFVSKLREHISVSFRASDNDKKTVLIVDDDFNIRNLLRQHLMDVGYRVREVEDGISAIREVKKEKPDLIILDVMMPEMNGYDVAAVFKNDPLTMSIPIIMFSVMEDKERGYKLGVDRYFTKSVDIKLLLDEIGLLTSREPENKKVIIVDDNKSDIKHLIDTLQEKGFEVLDRCNGEECKRKAKDMSPDMIILISQNTHSEGIINTLRYEHKLDNITFILLEGAD